LAVTDRKLKKNDSIDRNDENNKKYNNQQHSTI
jgi:hypothetical protein